MVLLSRGGDDSGQKQQNKMAFAAMSWRRGGERAFVHERQWQYGNLGG
jgi:hypothetical protein